MQLYLSSSSALKTSDTKTTTLTILVNATVPTEVYDVHKRYIEKLRVKESVNTQTYIWLLVPRLFFQYH